MSKARTTRRLWPGSVAGAAITLSLMAAASAPGEAQIPADPQASAVFEQAKQKFWDRLDGVENYTLYQAQNGLETTLYYEREVMDGVPVFVIVPPHEWEPELQQAPAASPPAGNGGDGPGNGPPGAPDLPGGLPNVPGLPNFPSMPGGFPNGPADIPDPKQALMQKGGQALMGSIGSGGGSKTLGIDPRMMDQLGERARLIGSGPCYEAEDLELLSDPGSGDSPSNPECHYLEITDLSGLDFGEDGEPEGFDLTSFDIRLDKQELVSRRTTVHGNADMDGYQGEIAITAAYADYRQVDQMYEPFRRITRMLGIADATMAMMDDDDRKEMEKALEQLDEMEEQLAQLPEAQRKMVEQQMGGQLEKMRAMAAGGGVEAAFGDYQIATEVTELLVNAGPPDVTGEWRATLSGPVALDVEGEAAGIAWADEAWQVTMAAPISGGLGRSSVIQLTWKRNGQGSPVVGESHGFGGITLVLDDGREGTFQTDEEGATIIIDSVSRTRVTGHFSFMGKGRVRDGITEAEGTVTLEGAFEGPVGSQMVGGIVP